ncbi:MAG TPA: shikimate dehydrogenase [Xanthobacteraceae bacterium]|jgi:shikimate dehydrogenase|nr:shikimate dehydrogenase [Xanthobacteraceae bacterium]
MTATDDGGRIVDGATRLYCIIGDPVAQTASPRVFSARFRAAGRNAILVPFHLPAAAFEPAVRGIMALANLDGIIVTVPYKARMLAFADRILPTARSVGAINALRREADGQWAGDMFDGRGMVRAITSGGHAVAGRNAVVIGAGGAGSAIACALAEAGAASLTLAEIDQRKARALAARIAAIAPACIIRVGPATTEGVDVLINASPVGMKPDDGLPAPLGKIDPHVVVADVVVADETPLLAHARACGCPTVRGQEMMLAQVDEMLAFFQL